MNPAPNTVQERIQQVTASVGEAANNVSQGVANTVANTRTVIGNTLSEFSNKGVVNGSSEFLNSNSIVAKFAFVIFVLLLFFFILYLGISLIGYFLQPTLNPYIIQGTIDGNNSQTITQDPKQSTSAVVLRSNNKNSGIEYSWSSWIYINNKNSSNKYQHVFNKGDVNFASANGISMINNAPGLYISPGDSTTSQCSLHILMDVIDTSVKTPFIDISGVPLNKWMNVVIRLKNTALDVYINGTVSGRLLLPSVPKQNYNNVNVAQNGGFSGKLSDLRYYSYALSAFEINRIVIMGPNTTVSKIASAVNNISTDYLSSQWFYSKM